MNIYFHRRNMVYPGYDPIEVVNGSEQFGTYELNLEGKRRNYSNQFHDVNIGDTIILECKRHENEDINGVWGITEVEEIIEDTSRGILLLFSTKKDKFKKFDNTIKEGFFDNTPLTLKRI